MSAGVVPVVGGAVVDDVIGAEVEERTGMV